MPTEVLSVVGSVAGGLLSSKGSKQAASTASDAALQAAQIQAQAADKAIAENRRQFDVVQSNLAPQRGIGYNALYALSDMVGLPRRFGSQSAFTDFNNQQQQLNPGVATSTATNAVPVIDARGIPLAGNALTGSAAPRTISAAGQSAVPRPNTGVPRALYPQQQIPQGGIGDFY